jgi:gliding motility-associated-like protein
VESFEAVATVGGAPPQQAPLQINHQPLEGISLITKVAIIQGETGTYPGSPPPFPQRFRPQDVNPQDAPDEIRVFVRYRFISPDEPNPNSVPFKTTDPVDGPDPTPFSIQIPPNEVIFGVFEYQIVVHRLPSGPPIYYPDPNEDGIEYFRVNSVASAPQVIGFEGGRVTLPDGNPNDGETSVDFPRGVFYQETSVVLTQVPTNSGNFPPMSGMPDPVAAYQMDTGQYFEGGVKVTALFQDFDYANNGDDGIINGTNYPESSVSLVWWDGYMWNNVGGFKNFQDNTVTARLPRFEYMAIVPMGAPAGNDTAPTKKIFTPNGDGDNDTLDFNIGGSGETITIEIFDMTGHRVRTLVGALQWDGRDSSGQIVESGVYIYQYKIGGTRVSGVTAVAK